MRVHFFIDAIMYRQRSSILHAHINGQNRHSCLFSLILKYILYFKIINQGSSDINHYLKFCLSYRNWNASKMLPILFIPIKMNII